MPGALKVVRFADDDIYYEPTPPTPSPSHSTSSLPSSSGPDTPPSLNHAGSPYSYKPLPHLSPVGSTRVLYPSHAGPVRIHPALGFSPNPLFSWDLAHHPSTARPQPTASTLAAPATSPPLSAITVISPLLPWSISIKPSKSGPNSFVTVADVLSTLHHALRLAVRQAEYDKLPSSEAKHYVNVAYFTRCGGSEDESRKGVRRIDFLGGRRTFLGLSSSRAAPNVWVLNVS